MSYLDDTQIDHKNIRNYHKPDYKLVPPNLSEVLVKVRLYLPEIYAGGADDLTFDFTGNSSDEDNNEEDDSSSSDNNTKLDSSGAKSSSTNKTSNIDTSKTTEENSASSSSDDDSSEDSGSSEETYNAIRLSKITEQEELKKRGNRNYWGNQVTYAESSNEDEDKDNDKKSDSDNTSDEMDKPIYNVTPDTDILKETNKNMVIDLDNQIIDLTYDKDYDSPDGSATLTIPWTENNYYNVKKGCRILIQQGYRYPNGKTDVKLTFSGYISNVKSNEGLLTIECKDLGELLNTKLEVEYNQMERSEIMKDIIENKIGLKSDIDFYMEYDDIIDYTTASKSDDSDDDDTYSGSVSADVKKAAKQICGSSKGKKALKKIYNWMQANVKYEYYSNTVKGASGTLKARAGNCCDQAQLCIAMARAVGIRAEFMYGTSCRFQDGSYNHVWGRYHVNGGWFEMDTVSPVKGRGWGSTAAVGGCSSKVCKGENLGF